MTGLIPYRDFMSSYAPLRSHVDAAALLFWKSPLAIILLAILAEIAMLIVWSRVAKSDLQGHLGRTALLLYAVSPMSLVPVAIDGSGCA